MASMRSLEEYDISSVTGFLPAEPPLRRLADPYFTPWEDMMDDFNGLLLAGKLREQIHKVRAPQQAESMAWNKHTFILLSL